MGRPRLSAASVARTTSIRLTDVDEGRLAALLEDANRTGGGIGEPIDRSGLIRNLIADAFRLRRPGQPPAPAPAPAPALRPAPAARPLELHRAAPPRHETEHVYATLYRLAGGSVEQLVDAATLVRASGLPIEVASAALHQLARDGRAQLRPAGETSRRAADFEPGRPRLPTGYLIGYVALLPRLPACRRRAEPAHRG